MPKGVYKRKKGWVSKTSFKKGNKPWNTGKKVPQTSGKNYYDWKGGRKKEKRGYILIHSPGHPFRDVDNRVYEHRLVIEKYLERYLTPKEVVHHVDKDRSNNKIANLILFKSNGYHISFHRFGYCNGIIFDGRKLSN